MEMKIAYCCNFAAFSVIIFMAWKALNWVWFKPKKLEKRLREEGFKGDSYGSLYGDLNDISAMTKEAISKPSNLSDDVVPRVMPYFLQIIKKHGKNSFLWYGVKPCLLMTDPELIKEVTLNVRDFPKPASFQFFELVAKGLAAENGATFSRHKKIISPGFHQDKLKLMIPSFSISASEMLSKWEEIVSAKGSSVVDVWLYLQTLASDALSRTAFGSNYEEGRKIFGLQREQIPYCLKNQTGFSKWRFLPTKKNRRLKENVKKINNLIMSMIDARMKIIKAGEACENDLLTILLKEINYEQGSNESSLSIQDVVEDCKLFYFAGQETTAVLLVWTMIMLSRFPEWQTRAREEVLQVFGTNLPHSDGLNQLKIVNMILYEVLRLYPPISQFLRTTTQEAKYGNITLPAGVQLCLPVMLVHHDSELWGNDVKEFKPERFAEGVSKATKGRLMYFPFGWGPRICIGQNFALLEARIAIAMILQKFSFELSPFYVHAPYSAITLQPQYGAHLILHKI